MRGGVIDACLGGEAWAEGELGECSGGYSSARLNVSVTETEMTDFIEHPDGYAVCLNGESLPYIFDVSGGMSAFADAPTLESATKAVQTYSIEQVSVSVKCPTDITNVEVVVAKK